MAKAKLATMTAPDPRPLDPEISSFQRDLLGLWGALKLELPGMPPDEARAHVAHTLTRWMVERLGDPPRWPIEDWNVVCSTHNNTAEDELNERLRAVVYLSVAGLTWEWPLLADLAIGFGRRAGGMVGS